MAILVMRSDLSEPSQRYHRIGLINLQECHNRLEGGGKGGGTERKGERVKEGTKGFVLVS